MLNVNLDEHTVEDLAAIDIMRKLGFSEDEIQRKYNEQKNKDKKNDLN